MVYLCLLSILFNIFVLHVFTTFTFYYIPLTSSWHSCTPMMIMMFATTSKRLLLQNVAEQETVEFALCGSRKIPRTSEIWINKICKMHSTSQYYVSSLQSRNQLPRSTKYSNLQLPPRSSLLLYMALHGNIFGLSCMNVHAYA